MAPPASGERAVAMPMLKLDGVDVHYEMAGSGHPIVLVHGHGLDSRMWDGQIAGLSRLYTVVRYDFRGHGKSSAPGTGYSRPRLAHELFLLVDALGLTKPSIVGHSRGGTVGLEYALTYPTRISTLTVVASGIEGYYSEAELAPTIAKQKALLRREGVSDRFVRAALRSPLYDGVRGDTEKLALLRTMLSAWSGADWRDDAVYPRPERQQIERLSDVGVPVMVVVGERDLSLFNDIAEVFAGGLRVVRRAVVPDAGHMAPMENPEAFNDILLDFIGGAAGKALL